MNANSVASVIVKQNISGDMLESILERSRMNANSVASVLVKREL